MEGVEPWLQDDRDVEVFSIGGCPFSLKSAPARPLGFSDNARAVFAVIQGHLEGCRVRRIDGIMVDDLPTDDRTVAMPGDLPGIDAVRGGHEPVPPPLRPFDDVAQAFELLHVLPDGRSRDGEARRDVVAGDGIFTCSQEGENLGDPIHSRPCHSGKSTW